MRKAAAASEAPVLERGPPPHEAHDEGGAAPSTANHAIHAGAGSLSTYSKSPGYTICRNIPAPSMSGSRTGPTRRASTPIPPAKANANGRKPAARRACEMETRSDSDVKSAGTSIAANTASEPPTTYAAHRRRAAKPASGTMSRAAIATAPERVNTSAARLYEVSDRTTS